MLRRCSADSRAGWRERDAIVEVVVVVDDVCEMCRGAGDVGSERKVCGNERRWDFRVV